MKKQTRTFEELMKDPNWVKIFNSIKKEVAENKKHGFDFDIKQWFNNELKAIEEEKEKYSK